MSISDRLLNVKERLNEYQAAEIRILKYGEEYSIGDRSLDRGDLAEIAKMIDKLQNECDRLENGSLGVTVNYGLPRST